MDTAIPTAISTNLTAIPNLINHRHHHLLSSSSTTKPKTTKLISNKTSSSTSTTLFTTSNTSTHGHSQILLAAAGPHIIYSCRHQYSQSQYHRASTGYAVALLEAARSHNVVEAVSRDVKRLSKWVMMAGGRGEIFKEVVKQGSRLGFEKHLVKLVKLLVDKGQVDLVSQVLSEFGKLYHQLLILNQHTHTTTAAAAAAT